MASSSDLFTSFLVFSLMVLSLCPYSASQSTQPSASGARSGGEPESGQTYVVAPNMKDCPSDTLCETVSYYAREYPNELANVVFWFLPGTHNLSRDWKMDNSRNVTFLGGNDLTNTDKTYAGMTKIVCQEFGSGGIHACEQQQLYCC